MRKVASSADLDHIARPAAITETRQTNLTRQNSRMGRDHVEGMRIDVEPQSGRPRVCSLERVDGLDVAIGFNDDQIYRRKAEALNPTGGTTQKCDNVVKHSHRQRLFERQPI